MTTGNQPPQQGQGQQQRGRPGAMTMAMRAVDVPTTGPKVLRIGVIQSGKIVEERIIRRRETVSVGSSERNHFVVQSPNMPARFELFQLVGSDYILNFTEDMRGRVGLPAGVQDLAQLRASGAARNAGAYWQVKLNDTSRGKVTIGETTLLFQFVSPPPVQPRPQLPAAARGGFVKGIDWVFTAFITFSFMMHFGFIIYLENADWELDTGIGELPPEVARMILDEPPPPPVPEEPTEDVVAEAPTEAPTEAPATATRGPSQASNANSQNTGAEAPSAAETGARMGEEAAAAAEMLLVGALGGEADSAFRDVLAGGAVTGNAADVLAQANGVGVASGAAGGALRSRGGGGNGSGEGGTLGSLGRAGGADVTAQRTEGTQVVEVRVRGNLRLEGGEAIGGDGDFNQALVVALIRQRLSAIRACYETQLRRNPQLAGKVTVDFTIQTTGAVSGVRASENTTGDDAVASCVTGVVSRFRWNPGPEGGSVMFSYPFVFAPQN
jgi:outer membrane biosynthesis protein TonB